MKKGLVIVLAILAVFAMVSCKNDPVASDGANIFVKGGLIFVEFDEPQEIALAQDYNAALFWQNAGEFILGEDGLPILQDNMAEDPSDLNHYYAKDAYLVLDRTLEYHIPLYSLGSSTLFVANTSMLSILDIFDGIEVFPYDKNYGLSTKASLYYNGGKSLITQTIEMTDVSNLKIAAEFEKYEENGLVKYTGNVLISFEGLGDGEYHFTENAAAPKYYRQIVEGKSYVVPFDDLINIVVVGCKDGKLNSGITIISIPEDEDASHEPIIEPNIIESKFTEDSAKKYYLDGYKDMNPRAYTYKILAEPELNGLETYEIDLDDITLDFDLKKDGYAVAILDSLVSGINYYDYTARLFNRDTHAWTDITTYLEYDVNGNPVLAKKAADTLIGLANANNDLIEISYKAQLTAGLPAPENLGTFVLYFHIVYPET